MPYRIINQSGKMITYEKKLLNEFFEGVANSLDNYSWLLRMEAEDASRHKVTANGGCLLNIAQKVVGTSSCFFGTNGYLGVSGGSESDFDLGADDWTIEGYFRFTQSTVYLFGRYDDDSNRWYLRRNTDGSWQFVVVSGGSVIVNESWADTNTTNTWYHVSLNHSGDSYELYVDGVSHGVKTDSSDIPNLSANFDIGRGNSGGVIDYFEGWIDLMSVSKGKRRRTGTFTPPTGFIDDEYIMFESSFEGSSGSTRIIDRAKPGYVLEASDDFSGVDGNSESVDGRMFQARYVRTGSNGTASISGGDYIQSMGASAGFERATMTLPRTHDEDFTWVHNYTTDVNANDEQAAWTIYVGGDSYSVRRNMESGQHKIKTKKNSTFDPDNNITSGQYLTGDVSFSLSGTTLTVTVGGVLFRTWTSVSTGLTAVEFDVSNNGTDVSLTTHYHTLVDGSSNELQVATDQSATVGFCPDVSGNEKDGTPTNVTYDPFIPAYIFDGSSYVDFGERIITAGNFTMYGVSQRDSGGNSFIFSQGDTTVGSYTGLYQSGSAFGGIIDGVNVAGTAKSTGVLYQSTLKYDSGEATHYTSGSQDGTLTRTETYTGNGAKLGAAVNLGTHLTGVIPAFLVRAQADDNTDRLEIESLLDTKYSV